MLKNEWKKWSEITRGVDRVRTTIDMIQEDFKDPSSGFLDHYMLFVLRHGGSELPFMVSIQDKDTLGDEFHADYSDNCDTPIYCRWAEEMKEFYQENWGDENGLIIVLTEAVRQYHYLLQNPSLYQYTRIITRNPVSSSLKSVKEIHSNPRVRVDPITNEKWNLIINASYVKITAYARVMSGATGFYCELRVLSPRLAIGRNVNFGGAVVAPGLVKDSPSSSITQLIERILSILDDEVPFSGSAYDYTEEEYEASITKSSVPSEHLGRFIIQVSNLPLRDNSSVVISNYRFNELIGNREILWLRIHNSLYNKDVWMMAHPSQLAMSDDEMRVPDTLLANLNCDPGDSLIVSVGTLSLVDKTGIIIRLRSRQEKEESVLAYVETMSSLCIGATYYSGVYFDVLYAGGKGACSLRGIADIKVVTEQALVAPQVVLSPLAIEAYSYDTEESSD